MSPSERRVLYYRDKKLGQTVLGLVALGIGCFLTYLWFGRGTPTFIQVPPPGSDVFTALLLPVLIIASCAVFYALGLLLLLGRRGANFSADPRALALWYRWFKWERVRVHALDGYDQVQIRSMTAEHAYFFLALLGKGVPELQVNTVYLATQVEAEVMAREVEAFFGWNQKDHRNDGASPNSDVGKT